MTSTPIPTRGTATWLAVWGALSVSALLIKGLIALAPLTLAALAMPLGAGHILFLIGWIAFMAYSEGYRGFQRSYSPRVVARAFHLAAETRPLHAALAPFYCMGLFAATRGTMIRAWSVTVGVIGLIIAVGQIPQPWRGLIDAGVLVGLFWGVVAMVWFFVAWWRAGSVERSLACLPDTAHAATTPAISQ